ncbi:MAG: hypothetical protein Fur0037_25250 [Planctomycetota bacterium]
MNQVVRFALAALASLILVVPTTAQGGTNHESGHRGEHSRRHGGGRRGGLPLPEPGTLSLLAIGAVGVGLASRRRKASPQEDPPADAPAT